MQEQKLHYKDIVLANPVYSDIQSRDDISSNVEFLGKTFNSCAIPANMQCSINFELAEQLSESGHFYILHRFYNYVEILNWVGYSQNLKTISISVGVKSQDYTLIDWLLADNSRVDFITIDIAFGHSILMKNMIQHIKEKLPDVKIIAGNVCTPEAVKDLVDWGADSVKVGLSCGAACSTFNSTGVGSPMFSAVRECGVWHPKTIRYEGTLWDIDSLYRLRNIPIIADGGIREVGDVCKALVAGANMVMVGSEFVKCIDSPAETKTWGSDNPTYGGLNKDYPKTKSYFGSASAKNKGHKKYVEGNDEVILQCNRLTYLEYFDKVNQGVRSCMSYHNLRDIKYMEKIKWSIHNG
jgi:GMP reductase